MTTLVLGLDGASFELLDPWIEAGRLPAIARLCEEGVAAGMESVPPPVTCPNWQAYATGRNPGKLGVYWWERVDAEAREIVPTSASGDFDGTHYWTYLDGTVAVVNLPTSYPPPAIDGIHVAGGPGAEQSGYTNPASLEADLEDRYDYAVHPERIGELSADDTETACIDEIYDLVETRFDVVDDLLGEEDHELIHLTVFYSNVLQHFYWDDAVTREVWDRIDARLGDLLDRPEVSRIVLMSDHGSAEIDTTFRINAWLEREGYLQTTRGASDWLFRLGLTRDRVRPVLSRLGLEWWLRRFLPRRLQTALPDSEGGVTEGAKASVIDWEESQAVASGQGPLYVLADGTAERERIRRELIDRLDGLAHDGRRVVKAAEPAEALYHGPHLDLAPDVVLRMPTGVHIDGAIGRYESPFCEPTRWRGENTETGLFVAHGPAVDPEAAPENLSILDLAPTLLHWLGYPVPEDVDGVVREEVFRDGSDPAEREVRTRDPATRIDESTVEPGDGSSDVTERLEDLGYLQ